MRSFPWAWFVVALLSGAPPAAAFSLYGPVDDPIAGARWGSDVAAAGVRVSVDAGVAGAFLPMGAQEQVQIDDLLIAAFRVWQNGALQFDITLGDSRPADIEVRAIAGTDPLLNGARFGYTYADWVYDPARTLSNGQLVPGWTIRAVRIYLAVDNILAVTAQGGRSLQLLIGQKVLAHEVGHAIGLGHTNDPTLRYYDTNLDPNDALAIDPAAPFADLVVSPNRLVGTAMSTDPCGGASLCAALLTTALTPDDMGGRDVLYPFVPEPTVASLLWPPLAGLALSRRLRPGRPASGPT